MYRVEPVRVSTRFATHAVSILVRQYDRRPHDSVTKDHSCVGSLAIPRPRLIFRAVPMIMILALRCS